MPNTPLFLLFTIIASVFSVSAQVETKASDLGAKIDTTFAEFKAPGSPGVAVIVIEKGEVLEKRSYGMASLEHQVPFTTQSVVRLNYSEGREFISIAAVLMEKDGKLSLNDKVRKHFPQLPAWSDSVTVWDLLNHRSGFVDEWATMLLIQNSMANRFDKSQFLNLLYSQPKPEIEPTKGYMYCNSDFGLLKLILEKASGEPLATWMKLRMFEPLKMTATRMHDNIVDVVPNLAGRYEWAGSGKVKLRRQDKISPGGNYYISTSAEDLALWATAHMTEEGEIAKANERLVQNVRLMPGKQGHLIFGQTRNQLGTSTVLLHQGVSELTYLTRIPSKGIAIVALTNEGNGVGPAHISLAKYLLGINDPDFKKPIFSTKPISLTSVELSQYTGRYVWQDQVSWQSHKQTRRTTELFVENGVLKARFPRNFVVTLTPVGKDEFIFEDDFIAQMKFSRTSPDDLMKITLTYDDGFPGARKVRETTTSWNPSPQFVSAVSGRYYSKHLDYYWTIKTNDQGRLIIRRSTVADTSLEPDGENRFRFLMEDGHIPGVGFDAWVTFHPEKSGKITHLTVDYQRLMDHRFDRVSK